MPEQPLWTWDDRSKRYRNNKSGRYIGIKQMQDLRVEFMQQQKNILRGHVQSYLDGDITVKRLEINVKAALKQTYVDMYAMGAGGRNLMGPRDWGSIGGMLGEQYKYLNGLMAQVNDGQISPAQANARLKMYVNSGNEALWRGYANFLPINLPAHPGDGSTVCLTNCQCEWEIVEVNNGFDCYWRLGAAEHCPDCLWRSQNWNPYHITVEAG